MLGRVLRHADYEVAAFASGEDFLASLALRVPACVILDVHMPGLSGFDVKSRLRAMGCDVPAIFITASDDRALDRSVLDAGGALAAAQAVCERPAAGRQLNVALRGASPPACHEIVIFLPGAFLTKPKHSSGRSANGSTSLA